MKGEFKLNDKYLDSEINECKKAVSQFHQGRRDFQQKITQIAQSKTYPVSPHQTSTRQVNQAYARQKEVQEAAAQNSKQGIRHLGYRGASVSPTEVPAWAATYEHKFPAPTITVSDYKSDPSENIKSASLEDMPAWAVTLENSPLDRSQNITNTTSKLKQASTSDAETPAWALCYDHVINKGT